MDIFLLLFCSQQERFMYHTYAFGADNIFNLQVSPDGNMSTSVLSFVPTRQDNGKTLTCRASNHLVQNGVEEVSIKLNVFCEFRPLYSCESVYFPIRNKATEGADRNGIPLNTFFRRKMKERFFAPLHHFFSVSFIRFPLHFNSPIICVCFNLIVLFCSV